MENTLGIKFIQTVEFVATAFQADVQLSAFGTLISADLQNSISVTSGKYVAYASVEQLCTARTGA